MRFLRLALLSLFFAATPVEARTARELFQSLDAYNEEGLALIEALDYQQGVVDLPDLGLRLDIPPSFYFLNSEQAYRILVDGWGNPPSAAKDVAGMILPAKYTPLDPNNWGATVTFEADGHVRDDDAGQIDPEALLATMRSKLKDVNVSRSRSDYATATLIGFAVPPIYDPRGHKLSWARELSFEGKQDITLNYAVRFLGRTGILSLNFVGRKQQLGEIKAAMPQVLKMAQFIAGARYEDFNPATDKAAPYGIAGLISGDRDTDWITTAKEWALRIFLILLALAGLTGTIWRIYVNYRKSQDPRRRI